MSTKYTITLNHVHESLIFDNYQKYEKHNHKSFGHLNLFFYNFKQLKVGKKEIDQLSPTAKKSK